MAIFSVIKLFLGLATINGIRSPTLERNSLSALHVRNIFPSQELERTHQDSHKGDAPCMYAV